MNISLTIWEKNPRIDCAAPTTHMMKFSARLDFKNSPHENRPSRGPIKSQNKIFCLIIISKFQGRICTFSNWSRTSHWVIIAVILFVYSHSVTSLTKSRSNFEKNLCSLQKELRILILKPFELSPECFQKCCLNSEFFKTKLHKVKIDVLSLKLVGFCFKNSTIQFFHQCLVNNWKLDKNCYNSRMIMYKTE